MRLLLISCLAFFSLFAEEMTTETHTVNAAPSELTVVCEHPQKECPKTVPAKEEKKSELVLEKEKKLRISVFGEGVAPMNTTSPAQAYALAKRAAIADAYRLIAEKIKGVRIEGQDVIKNMMVKRSIIRTEVDAMIRDANVVETTFKEGLCEVEMEIVLSYEDFQR